MIKYPIDVKVLDKWLPSRARSAPPTGIVLHATGGSTATGAIETLRDRGLSYHYLICDQRETDGRVYKCVPTARVALHAGNSYGPNEAARGVSRRQNSRGEFTAVPIPSVNNYTLSISFVNLDTGRDPYSEMQWRSAIEISLQLIAAFPTISWISTHALVSPRRKVDPNGFPIAKFATELGLTLWRAL